MALSATVGLTQEAFGLVDNVIDGIPFGGGALPTIGAASVAGSLGGFGGFYSNVFRQISSPGISPGATAADNVLAVITLPPNAFDGLFPTNSPSGGRGLLIRARGVFAATANNKTLKIIWNATTAVVGSTVTGGTTIASSGVVATNNLTWLMEAEVFKFGAANSNTQIAVQGNCNVGGVNVVPAVGALPLPTATENGPIIIAITGNAATATTDIVLNIVELLGLN